jgi:hypothetical protein
MARLAVTLCMPLWDTSRFDQKGKSWYNNYYENDQGIRNYADNPF